MNLTNLIKFALGWFVGSGIAANIIIIIEIIKSIIRKEKKMKQINNEEFKNIRKTSKMTQREFATFFKIPYWTIVNWENEKSQCPEYVTELLKFCLTNHYRFDFLHCENCKNNCRCNKIGVEFKCQKRQIIL